MTWALAVRATASLQVWVATRRAELLRQLADAVGFADAAVAAGVGLHDIDRAGAQQLTESLHSELVLPGGDGNRDLRPESDVVVDVLRFERFLVPEDVQLREYFCHAERDRKRIAHGGVDDDVDVGADRFSDGGHRGDVLCLAHAQAHLDPAEAIGDMTLRFGAKGIEIAVPEQPAGVGGHRGALGSQQGCDALAECLAAQVPAGHLYAANG